MCLLYRKNAEKTKSKPVRFEFGRKNKGAKYSFRRQAETERCELVLTCVSLTEKMQPNKTKPQPSVAGSNWKGGAAA